MLRNKNIISNGNRILTSVIVFIVLSLISSGQQIKNSNDTLKETQIITSPWMFGFSVGYQYNYHSVNFHGLPDVPSCCPDYSDGYGYTPVLGIISNYTFEKLPNITFELRLNYNNLNGDFTAYERQAMNYTPDSSVSGLIKHTINTSLNAISLIPQIRFNYWSNLHINAGLSISKIFQTYFEQNEELIEPEDLVFENGLRTRMHYNGKIKGINNLIFSLNFGVGYDLLKSKEKNWHISPELFISYGLNSLLDKEQWKTYSANLNLAFYYYKKEIKKYKEEEEYQKQEYNRDSLILAQAKHKKNTIIDTVKIIRQNIQNKRIITGVPEISSDTLHIKNKIKIVDNFFRTDTLLIPKITNLTAQLDVAALDKKNQIIRKPVFQIEEYLSIQMHPLLHYIFFDENSAKIPDRYTQCSDKNINESNLNALYGLNSLEVYHHILNIVGFKLKEDTKSILTLIGCNSNVREEKNNLELSRKRAEEVKNYLVTNCKINPKRIKIKARNLPAKPSNVNVEDGIAENRRVEIYINKNQVIPPLIIKDTLVEFKLLMSDVDSIKTPSFTGFRFFTHVKPNLNIKNWKIYKIQNKDTTMLLEGKGEVPKFVDYYIHTEDEKMSTVRNPINFGLTVTNELGIRAYDIDSIKIKRKTIRMKKENLEGDYKIDSYTLMLFDYNSSKLSTANKDVPKLIKPSVEKNSTVTITGYSDKLGEEAHNLKLSKNRARRTAQALNHKNSTYKGVGEAVQLYSNNTPEGRFYCRTVNVIIKTPITWKKKKKTK